MRRMLGTALVLGALAVPAAHAVNAPLARYWSVVSIKIHTYRGFLKRLEELFSEERQVNVDPVVEDMYTLSDRFERLSTTWASVSAPKGLGARHRGMGRVFALYADAIRIHAAAVFTRHPDEIAASNPKFQARLRSAAYLQHRWAVALQGALVRAGIPVPHWLHGMATGP